ncbi:O-antigen ligase family protein, partial [bacterium]|nr:O-antigen ligase family protein [bacterium]
HKITGFKIRISLLFISLPALLLLRSRSVVIALFLTLIFIGKKKILKFLTVSLILTQIILIIVLFICPDKILDQTDLNYRFYIWRCASDKFNNLHKTGINLFKKDSYELQLKVTEANHNYLYYINQIDTLHNDFLQVFYDYSFIGILLIFFLLFRCIKHDSTCFNPIIFFILSVSVFHNLIYSPAFLFFIAPLCKSFLPRREIKFSKIPSTMTIMILSFIIILFFSFFIKADYLNENGLLTMDMTMFEKSIKLLPGYYYPYSIIPQMDESRHKLINTAILYRKDPNFYLIKGLNAEKLYFKTGKTDYFKESIFSYHSAVKLDPLNIKTRMSLFDLYKLNGMSKEADSEMHYIKNLKLPTRLKDQIRLQDAFKNIISHKGTKTQREKKEN